MGSHIPGEVFHTPFLYYGLEFPSLNTLQNGNKKLTSRYFRRLEAHKSCVNALKFSSGEGRFLASGGDGTFLVVITSYSTHLCLLYNDILLFCINLPT